MDDTFPVLEIGLRVVVQAETRRGRIRVQGEITYIGGHHFRVTCDTRFPSEWLPSKKMVKLFLEDKENTLPMASRFIRHMDKSPYTIVLGFSDQMWRTNRRAFFRGQLPADVTVTRLNGTRRTGRVVNISGGGILAEFDAESVKSPLVKLEEVEIQIDFEDGTPITAKGRVVWYQTKPNYHQCGLKFTGISRRDQDRICRMVIVQEFENRRAEIRELVARNAMK